MRIPRQSNVLSCDLELSQAGINLEEGEIIFRPPTAIVDRQIGGDDANSPVNQQSDLLSLRSAIIMRVLSTGDSF